MRVSELIAQLSEFRVRFGDQELDMEGDFGENVVDSPVCSLPAHFRGADTKRMWNCFLFDPSMEAQWWPWQKGTPNAS